MAILERHHAPAASHSQTDDRVRSRRDALLVALTVSTGAVDAIAWLGLGKVFSAFMTGNLVFLGLHAGGVDAPSLPRIVAAIAAFAVGAALGARIVAPAKGSHEVWPRRVSVGLAAAVMIEAGFLVGWLVVDGEPSPRAGDALIAASALAMGLQTMSVFALDVRGVFTTATTATWGLLMGDLSGGPQARAERRRLAGVIVGLVVGAAAGGFLVLNARLWAPVLPLVLTALVVAVAETTMRVARREEQTADTGSGSA